MDNNIAMVHEKNNLYRNEKIELRNAKLLYFLMSALLILDWIMPQYFGFHIGFDFTTTRIMNVLILVYFVLNRKAGNHFIRSVLDVEVTPFLAIYMFVMVYTTVLRVNVNTFFLNFLDILTFYMVYYGIRYVIGVRKAIRWTVGVAWFFSIYGLAEYCFAFSPMLEYLQTLPYTISGALRSGQYRIMGPCGHSIGYGLLLMLLIAVVCIDYEKDEMNLFKHPVLYCLLMLNMFLTGSRGPLGIAILESALIILFSKRERRKKTLLLLVIVLSVFAVLEVALIGTPIGRYIMVQLTSVIDEILGTNYAAYWGADTLWLEQSSSYREVLPRVFTVSWLNPFLGQGANAGFKAYIDGVYVKSIDNFYIALYIRYAYPGLVTYALFFIMTIFFMLKTGFQKHSGLCIALAIGVFVYCLNLFWVDYLQTTKYMYILVAIYAAYYSEKFQSIGAKGLK